MSAVCPECDNPLDIDNAEAEEGDTVHCVECGTAVEILSVDPLEIAAVDEDGYDEEEDAARVGEEDDE